MSTQKPKGKEKLSAQRDDLDLDAEVVRDLEPEKRAAERIVGGRPPTNVLSETLS